MPQDLFEALAHDAVAAADRLLETIAIRDRDDAAPLLDQACILEGAGDQADGGGYCQLETNETNVPPGSRQISLPRQRRSHRAR